MKKKILNILLIIAIIETICIFIPQKEYKPKIEKVTKEVDAKNLEEIDTSNNTFAYYQDDVGDGSYVEKANQTSWPDMTNYGYVKSVCTDGAGATVEPSTVLSFDGKTFTANIGTTTSLHCYLYFAKADTLIGRVVKNAETNKDFETEQMYESRNTTLTGSSYKTIPDTLRRFSASRYNYSANFNNYMCFGTKDQNSCTANKELYMYRIIGIDVSETATKGQIKIVKNTPLRDDANTEIQYKWHTSDSNVAWPSSALYTNLNGSYFLTNKKYSYMQNTTWTNLIVAPSVWYTGVVEQKQSSNSSYEFYSTERSTNVSNNGKKISLPYASDALIGQRYSYDSYYGTTSGVWMAISWTSTRCSYGNSAFVTGTNYWTYPTWLNQVELTSTYSVTPSFYLKSGLKFAGNGSESDPYIITNV